MYLEPGEACALNAGYLLSRVLDVVRNGETTNRNSGCQRRLPYAGCHRNAVSPAAATAPVSRGRSRTRCRLAGPTCLAGDVIGDYSFDAVPAVGGLLVFGDMAIYTTCKNNTFNGMPLPGDLFPHSVRRYPRVSVVRLQRFQIQARQPVNATAKAAVVLKLVSAAGWVRWFSSAVVNVLSVLFVLK